ncbi:MAG: MFS transporter [Christensenellales bacterium]
MESNQSIENNKTLKLNTKNTLYIGCAFFSILMLWQMYNNYCPLFLDYLLRKKYGESNEFIIGIIMAGDNALAIFMLPLFGSLSDKTNCKYGKRMPYIVIGMILSALFFPLIAIMFYIESLLGVIIMMAVILIIMNMYRNPAVALMPDVTPKPLRSKANGIINFVGYLGAIFSRRFSTFSKNSQRF